MIKKLAYILLISLLISCNQEEENLRLIFTGDVILDRGVNDELELHGDSLLTNSFDFLKDQDFLVINLEGTFTDNGIKQADKFNFKANKNKTKILKEEGVTHVSIANNHVFDYGKLGYKNTIQALEDNNLKPLGNSVKPTILKKGKYQCAVLSASLTTHNDSLPISSTDVLKESVNKFLNESHDIPLILYIHWGLELQPTPEKWQTDLAKELVDLGVSAIIGHHPHITQTVEFIKNIPVFYSLGNFIADAYLTDTDMSYVVELEIKNDIESVNIIPTRLQNYFPKQLTLKEQISDLKKHVKYSDISLIRNHEKWNLKQTDKMDFSEVTDLWMISEKSTISIIKKLQDNSYLLKFQKDGVSTNVINLHGKLSEYQIADVNNDLQTDILIGISKKVKFDPNIRKRINIYTFQNNALEPLWLGTKFVHDIESFDILNHNNLNYLTTTERINKAETIDRVYEWDDFGFALTELN